IRISGPLSVTARRGQRSSNSRVHSRRRVGSSGLPDLGPAPGRRGAFFSPPPPPTWGEGGGGGEKSSKKKKHGLTRPRLHSRQRSAAAAALSDSEIRETRIAAPV